MIKEAKFINSETCVEALQKKTEFGGAIARFNNIKCNGLFESDQISIIIK